MKIEQEHSEEFAKLTEEIRSLGTPYQSSEPDELYWANFRVRVMERVEEKRGLSGWLDRVQEYVTTHILGTSLVGAAAVAVALAIVVNPFGKTDNSPNLASQIAGQQKSTSVAPEQNNSVVTPATPPSLVTQPKPEDRQIASQLTTDTASNEDLLAMADDAPSEVESQSVMSHGDGPVSLNELSAPELESVLEGVKELK